MRCIAILISMGVSLHGVDAFARQSEPAWEELGGSATGLGVSNVEHDVYGHASCVDSMGRPIVAWTTPNGLMLRRWSGSAWEELGGSASGSGISGGTYVVPASIDILVDSSDNPWVAWVSAVDGLSTNREIFLRRWTGSAWEQVGGSATGGGVSDTPGTWSRGPSVALDPAGNPWVAWHEETGPSRSVIYLRRWTGSEWSEVGGSASGPGLSNDDGLCSYPSIAIGLNGIPMVAWSYIEFAQQVVNQNREVYLRMWNGAEWAELGGSATGGGISDTAASSRNPVMRIDAAGLPVIAWVEGPGPDEIYVRRWNGTSWAQLGGSASPGGISGTPGFSYDPSMDLDPSGNPIVCWMDGSAASPYETYLRRWDGSAWLEVSGSGSGGGISDTGGFTQYVSVSVSRRGNLAVSWTDRTPGDTQVYLRYWTNPIELVVLGQSRLDGIAIQVGGEGFANGVTLGAQISWIIPVPQVVLEIEARFVSVGLAGVVTHSGSALVQDEFMLVQIIPVALGDWHWAARLNIPGDEFTPWVEFGGNSEGEVDFTIISTPNPAPPPAPGGGGGGGGGGMGCGLTGLEAVVVAGALLAWTRRRSRRS